MIWRKTKITSSWVSGRFELSTVRVTPGKTIVNVWRKSMGNPFWFELARIRVIGSRLYFPTSSEIACDNLTNYLIYSKRSECSRFRFTFTANSKSQFQVENSQNRKYALINSSKTSYGYKWHENILLLQK